MATRPRYFPDLRSFADHLERAGLLRRVQAEVDPVLEVPEIVQRVIRERGPALLFERPKGAVFPLVMNLFGTMERIELALGRHPQSIGSELVETLQRLNPPSLKSLWESRRFVARGRFMRPRIVSRAPVQEVVEAPRLNALPHVKSWPRDGGRFVTFGPTITHDPASGRRNYGLYRLQIYDDATTGMHWQSMKGGRGHHYEAERRGQPLEAAVVLGGDPILMLSAILPLPEDMDELAFAGFLRGAATELVPGRSISIPVPANAELILEGVVPPGERRPEGPFGDHFGHYSEAADFPVFHVRQVTRRQRPLYPATVVGKPPQEDKAMGIAVGEMVGPLIRMINPNVVDLYAFENASFHNLLGVSLKERHPKEVIKTAFNLLGTGQLALTKVTILVAGGCESAQLRRAPPRALVPVRARGAHAAPADRPARYAGLHLLPHARRQQAGAGRHRRAAHQRPSAPSGRRSRRSGLEDRTASAARGRLPGRGDPARAAGGARAAGALGGARPGEIRRGGERGRGPRR